MNRSVRTWMLLAVIIFCLVIFFLPTSVGQDRKTYEVPTQVYGVPAWRSDAAHAVDAYERLMQRYTDLTERSMAGMAADLNGLARRLDAIDAKLTALDTRLARIEQHLYPVSASATAAVSLVSPPPQAVKPVPHSSDTKSSAPTAVSPSVPAPPADNSLCSPGSMQ
jgi:hypothetical protein